MRQHETRSPDTSGTCVMSRLYLWIARPAAAGQRPARRSTDVADLAWSGLFKLKGSATELRYAPNLRRSCSGTTDAFRCSMPLIDLPDVNPLTSKIIKAAIEVHRTLGPGLFESVYLACLIQELREGGLSYEAQKPLPVVYKSTTLECGFRLDLIVQRTVVVEVKALAQVAPIHRAQLRTYLVLTGCPAGLLINFNVPILKDGVTRVLNTKENSVSP